GVWEAGLVSFKSHRRKRLKRSRARKLGGLNSAEVFSQNERVIPIPEWEVGKILPHLDLNFLHELNAAHRIHFRGGLIEPRVHLRIAVAHPVICLTGPKSLQENRSIGDSDPAPGVELEFPFFHRSVKNRGLDDIERDLDADLLERVLNDQGRFDSFSHW